MHPFLPLFTSHLLVLPILTFVPPSSAWRPVLVLVVLLNCAISLQGIDYQAWWSDMFGLYVCGFGLNVSYVAFLRPVSPPPSWSTIQKLKWGLRLLFDSRSGIPSHDLPSFRREDPLYVPPKGTFLLQRSWTFAWTLSGFFFFRQYALNVYLDDFQSPKDHLLRRLMDVSPREWVILIHLAFTNWFLPYCSLTAAHSLASVFAVACGDAPGNWRPLFGNIRDAYTVQRFFGVFWHKLLRKAFTGHASFLIHDVMGIPRRIVFARHATILTAFLISGIMHLMIRPRSLSCLGPWHLAFYCLMGVTVALERVLQQIYDHSPTAFKGKMGARKACWRTAGYAWVACFHLWTTAKFAYPPMQCMSQRASDHVP